MIMRLMSSLLLAIFILPAITARAQAVIPDKILASQNSMRTLAGLYTGTFVQGIAPPPGKVIRECYLSNYWNNASILLTDQDEVFHFPVKYNIRERMIELNTKSGVKLLVAMKVKGMVWIDSVTQEKHYFVNGTNYSENGDPLNGLVEVQVDGKKPLLKRTTVYIKKPDYNVALDVGSRDEIVYQRIDYFILTQMNAVKVKSKKDVLKQLDDKKDQVIAFMEEQNLEVKREKDLCKVMEFYNAQFPAVN